MKLSNILRTLTIAVAIFAYSVGANAQSFYEKEMSEKQGEWQSIGGTYLGWGDDNEYYMSFPFPFYHDNQRIYYGYVNTNGYISLNYYCTYITCTPGYYYAGYNVVAPINTDMYTNGDVRYQVDGNVGSRVLTVQWNNVEFYYRGGQRFYFQAKFYEGSNNIELIYGPGFRDYRWTRTARGFIGGRRVYYYGPYYNIRPQYTATTSYFYPGNNTSYWYSDARKNFLTPGYTYLYGTAAPEIVDAYPKEMVDDEEVILMRGYVYTGDQHPAVFVKRDAGWSDIGIKYEIYGPLPSTHPNYSLIYQSAVGGNTDAWYYPSPQPVGDPARVNIPEAVGIAAGDNGDLDLTSTNIPGGEYVVKTKWICDGEEFEFTDQFFNIALRYDLAVHSVQGPKSSDRFKYPLSSGNVPIEVKVSNIGLTECGQVWGRARIYDSNDELVYQDSVYWEDLDDMLQTGDYVTMRFRNFRPRGVGDYRFEFYCEALDWEDDEWRNNYFPRQGESFYFNVAHEIEAEALSITNPDGEIYRKRPIIPKARFKNNGVSDMSDVPANMKIWDPQGNLVYDDDIIIQDIPQGLDYSEVPFDANFIPPVAGEYSVCVTVTAQSDPIRTNDTVCSTFEVIDALAGEYTIGETYAGEERNFLTFTEAMNAMYMQGITGDIIFLLTDASYDLGDITMPMPAALDISGKIIGNDKDAKITFKAHPSRANQRAGVTVNLHSNSGVGIRIAQTIDPMNTNAAVHQVTPSLKKEYSTPGGYITFDGGRQKALRFRLNAPSSNPFRAVFYLGNGAHNVSVKNCLIENYSQSNVSYSSLLPLTVYDQSLSRYVYQDDVRDEGSFGYSAGVVLRSKPPVDNTKENINTSNQDTLVNRSNVISGNEIRDFGYGVVSLGIGTLYQTGENAKYKRYYNTNNTITENVIYNVSRAGVFVGHEENTVISKNRIYNVTGETSDHSDAAGIILGGDKDARGDWFGYNNIGVRVDGNEISGVNSDGFAYGVKVEQSQVRLTDPSQGIVTFPDVSENTMIFNNVIWGINNSGSGNIAGVRLYTEIHDDATGDWLDMLTTPSQPDYFTKDDQIINNTIIIGDGSVKDGMVAGVMLSNAEETDFYNNAIAIEDETSHEVHSAIFYQGELPKNGGLNSDRNAYFVDGADASMFQLLEIDEESVPLNETGDIVEEFGKVAQWQYWTGSDANSVEGDFTSDYELTGNNPQKMRVITVPQTPLGSILNNRGERIDAVGYDLDGNVRGTAGQRYDIGACEFNGRMYASDLEMVSILEPGAYQSTDGLFSDAEYIMTEAPINVVARIRNNGSLQLNDVEMTLRIYRETPEGTFDSLVVQRMVTATSVSGQTLLVSFQLDEGEDAFMPETFGDLRNREIEPAYQLPGHFATMEANVTPRYKIEIVCESDQYNFNNKVEKTARFYLKRAGIHLALSTENSMTQLDEESNADQIAGRLNADSLITIFDNIGWSSDVDNQEYDIDIFDRNGWEPKAVNYTMYNSIYWSDGDSKGLTRYERLDLHKYLAAGDASVKKNVVFGSEEYVQLSNVEFVNDIFRASSKYPYNPLGTGVSYAGEKVRGNAVGRNLEELISATEYEGDNPPFCGLMDIYPEGDGLAREAYYYLNLHEDAEGRSMGVATTTLNRNVIILGVDWRHWDDGERVVRATVDFFDKNGGTIIPVELTEFEAQERGKKVELFWTTASEYNFDRFEIEKADMNSAGRGDFAKIGEVKANGNSGKEISYGPVSDYDVDYGNSYVYRLKLVDVDGKFDYSDEQIATIEGLEGSILFGQPKPNVTAGGIVTVDLNIDKEVELTVEMFDMNGKLINTLLSGVQSAGYIPVKVDMANLSSGVYTLVLKSGDVVITRQIRVAR